jgi:hypothetical protein
MREVKKQEDSIMSNDPVHLALSPIHLARQPQFPAIFSFTSPIGVRRRALTPQQLSTKSLQKLIARAAIMRA